MKKQLLIAAVLCIALIPGCQCVEMMVKDFESETAGLNRTITVYTLTGERVGVWTTKTTLSGGEFSTIFFDSTGHRVTVVGHALVVSVEH